MCINQVTEKLKVILSLEKSTRMIFDIDVAIALDMSKQSLSQLKKRNKIPYEQIIKFCEKRNISIDSIFFNQIPTVIEESKQKYLKIKYINEEIAYSNIDDVTEFVSIDKKLLDSLYKLDNSNPNSIIALKVMTDSMEPTLNNKEIILFDKDNLDISKGGIFIILTNIGILVKRVSLKIDGSIELISDNKNYNSELIEKNELNTIKILGKVVGKVGMV